MMKRLHRHLRPVLAPLIAGALLIPAGCQTPPDSAKAFAAAVVPGADLLVTIDFEAVRRSAFQATLQSARRTRADTDAEFRAVLDRKTAFWSALQLDPETLRSAQLTGDLDSFDPAATPAPWSHMNAVMAWQFTKPLTLERFQAGLAGAAGTNLTQVSAVQVDHRPALQIGGGTNTAATVWAGLSKNGYILYMALNEASLAGALKRDAQDTPESLPSPLVGLDRTLPADHRVRLSALVSNTARAKILKAAKSSRRPGASGSSPVGLAAILMPLKNTRTLTGGARFDQTLDASLTLELSGDQEAAQTALALQLLAGPLLLMASPPEWGAIPGAIGHSLRIESKAATLTLRASLAPQDLVIPRPAAAGKADATGGI